MNNEQELMKAIGLLQLNDERKRQIGDLMLQGAANAGTAYAKYDQIATPFARGAQDTLTGLIGRAGGGTRVGSAVGRLAGGSKALGLLKALPAAGAVGGVLGAADVIAGPDSAANKVMDTTGLIIGTIAGIPGGPVGMAAGAGLGKATSDGLQWLFGDRKTAEQRKMEEALAALNGVIV